MVASLSPDTRFVACAIGCALKQYKDLHLVDLRPRQKGAEPPLRFSLSPFFVRRSREHRFVRVTVNVNAACEFLLVLDAGRSARRLAPPVDDPNAHHPRHHKQDDNRDGKARIGHDVHELLPHCEHDRLLDVHHVIGRSLV